MARHHSENRKQLLNTEAGLPQNRTQRASIQFRMIRNNYLREGTLPTKDDVAPVLPLELKP